MQARFELLAVAGQDRLGEGPWWDVRTARLWWIDILGCRIRNAGLDGAEAAPLPTPGNVGFAVPTVDGGLVAGLRAGLFRHDDGAWERLWEADYDTSTHRLNDGKTDRSGRLWFGSMEDAETAPTAHLYRYDGSTRVVLDGVTTSNGLGWSPDGRTFYYSDSPRRTIWAFDFDPDSGTLGNRRVFATDPKGRFPDGLTVDADGCVWSAKWDGGRVVRYLPDGTVDQELELPVRKPASVAFVGAGLDTLAVTSANLDEADGEHAGRVFLVATAATGLAEVPAVC